MTTQTSAKLGLILNTRPADYHDRFHDAFGDLPWAIYDCPLTRPEPVSGAMPAPETCDAVIFTSQMGVKMFWPDPRWLKKKVYAVGSATAEAASRAGFTDVLQTGDDVEDLRRYLNELPFSTALYPSAQDVTADLSQEFPGRILRVPIYDMVARTDLPRQFVQQVNIMPIVTPLFSHRGAAILADLLTKAGITSANSKMSAVGMSAEVFNGIEGPWRRMAVAHRPTLEAMVVVTDKEIVKLNL